MQSGLRFGSCLLLGLLAQVSGYAQQGEVAERELKEALIQYKVQLEDLAVTRGGNMSGRRATQVVSVPFDNEEDSYLLRGLLPINFKDNLSRERISAALENFPQQTAVLLYSYKGDWLRIWLIDKEGIQAYHNAQVSRVNLNRAIADLRRSLNVDYLQLNRVPRLRPNRKATARRSPRPRLKDSINSLTGILLPPTLAPKLTAVRHLIISPVLGIGTVPFAILQPFGKGDYLIDKMSISVAPSVYDVTGQMEAWAADFESPLVVGNPYFPPSPKWEEVPSLPGAEAEAGFVARFFKTKPLIGKRATKRAILDKAQQADFLYFATHGIANSDDPLSGGFLMFSADELEQGLWTAKEIQEARFKAKIAVLSACQTGLGRAHDAGIIGLSRAFQIAGVPRVAMSLWSVDDEATAELMRSFVTNLRRNIPSEALRLAILDVKRHQPDPSKWASFVLFGTPR